MASSHPNQFQQFLQIPSSKTHRPKPFFSDLYEDNSKKNMETGQIPQQVTYFNNLDHHQPYIPPFQVPGLAPNSVQEENGLDLQWNFGLELNKKGPKEQVLLQNSYNNNNNNNSQISSSVDFLQARSVSTGLELSLDNPRQVSSGESALIGLVGDNLERELRRNDAEIDRYVRIQGDRLRQAILEKFQANQLQTISYIEDKVLQKLREKDEEVEKINKKNMELQSQIEQLVLEANTWQEQAKYNENMINTLKLNLHQVYYAQKNMDVKEGCGDSEADDTASFCNGLQPLCKNRNEINELMLCKVCRVNEVCMLLLPCQHLCLCKMCEHKLTVCPLCQSKYTALEVYR